MNINEPTFHRAFGTYGIYYNDGKLLVIHKQGGPYTYRYDLPGGSLEDFETLPDALDREFQEETSTSYRRVFPRVRSRGGTLCTKDV